MRIVQQLTMTVYQIDICLEISCRETPYLVSCYGTVTSIPISIEQCIGLLVRKLRKYASAFRYRLNRRDNNEAFKSLVEHK